MKKKITMKSFVGNLLFIAFLLLICNRFLSVTNQVPFPINIVSENSMYPYLMEGDLVAWVPTDIEEVDVGDVIVFRSRIHWPEEKLVVHRVVRSFERSDTIFLETKGDANEWRDQKGPHIPEPYITENNFIGKTLSVGSFPIKLPLIGILGIWVNEGLSAISQSSASKGTMTYLGVFTPLTIAIILLIVSLFLIPEKAKTVKEKIRIFIFGYRGIAVLHTFLFFLFIFVFLFSFIHVFAYDITSASVGVGEFADGSDLKLGSIEPGQTGTPQGLPLINPSLMPVKGFLFGTDALEPLVDRRIFSMNPGEFKQIEVTASAPQNTPHGSYKADVKVYSSPLWFLVPDIVMNNVFDFNPEFAVFFMDFFAAGFFTLLTIGLMIMSQYIEQLYQEIKINRCWYKTSKFFLKRGALFRLLLTRKRVREWIYKRYGWIASINIRYVDKKSFLIIVPVLVSSFLIWKSEILAVLIATCLVGIICYLISCKTRKKIVYSTAMAFIIGCSFVIIHTNVNMAMHHENWIDILGLLMGSLGVFMLMLSLFIVPLCLFAWGVVHRLRNLKEHKDPLLVLEGQCDL